MQGGANGHLWLDRLVPMHKIRILEIGAGTIAEMFYLLLCSGNVGATDNGNHSDIPAAGALHPQSVGPAGSSQSGPTVYIHIIYAIEGQTQVHHWRINLLAVHKSGSDRCEGQRVG